MIFRNLTGPKRTLAQTLSVVLVMGSLAWASVPLYDMFCKVTGYGGTTNTADVGCISTCLAIAFPYVDDDRKRTYLDALRRYADEYAAQWQLPSGGFTNGRWAGADMTTPYSVATGTQGMSFCCKLPTAPSCSTRLPSEALPPAVAAHSISATASYSAESSIR